MLFEAAAPFFFLLASGAPALVAGWAAPGYSGFRQVWSETFPGGSGDGVNEGTWDIITNINVNNELQRYTRDRANMQISGGGTVQIVPRRNAQNGEWTSGRIESKYTFTPEAGRVTRAEALIRFGDNPTNRKKGLWPAFWLLGDSIRRGTGWPRCGEVDVFEQVNGVLTGYGTIHCDVYPGGLCNEGAGIGGTVSMPDQGWHTWRVEWDRRPGSWASQTLTWFRDGQQFHQVVGARLNEDTWNALAAKPLFFILNQAVGGNWPGNPDANTLDGFGSMLEAAYIAHYVST